MELLAVDETNHTVYRVSSSCADYRSEVSTLGLKYSYLSLKAQLKLVFLANQHWLLTMMTPLLYCLSAYFYLFHRTFCTALWLWRDWWAVVLGCKLLGFGFGFFFFFFTICICSTQQRIWYLVRFQQLFVELNGKKEKRSNWWISSSSWLHVFFLLLISFYSYVYHPLFTY